LEDAEEVKADGGLDDEALEAASRIMKAFFGDVKDLCCWMLSSLLTLEAADIDKS
jgi:hypothetical protein